METDIFQGQDKKIKSKLTQLFRPMEFLAAGLSGLLQSFVLTPNEGFKVHCQDGKRFREVWKTKTVGKTPLEVWKNYLSKIYQINFIMICY